MKPLDWLLILVIATAFVLCLIWLFNQHKKGRYIGCGGDCDNCFWAQFEHPVKKK